MSHSGDNIEAGKNGESAESQSPQLQSSSTDDQLLWANRRARQLLDESNRQQADNRALQERLQRVQQDQRRLADLLARAQELVQAMEAGIRGLQGSVSLQLGYLMVQSSRSLRGLLSLPVKASKLLRSARRNSGKVLGRDSQIVQVPLPHEWFPPELHQELERFHAELAEADPLSRAVGLVRGDPQSTRLAPLPDSLDDVRIAAVMDEFTFSAYAECCDVTQVTPDGWMAEIEAIRPHLLFIESAWEGKDSAWLRKISGTSSELRLLMAHCRRQGIPTVFWNKEDPVHFKTFLATARLADVVFTTDIDCVKQYKGELGHERVFLLPFATQPRANHPIERYERKPGFCFAGSYYARYPVRQRDFASLISAVSQLGAVDIYDRNHGKDHPNYIFPPEYGRYILGRLSFDQIDLAYKGYDFGININTVKHSQSMFARRVFDLLASNTTAVSNFSRGMRLMFGDLVISSDDKLQLVKRLKPLIDDDVIRRKHRLLGLRKVMAEHTYQHRLGYLLSKVFTHAPTHGGATLFALARVGSEQQLQRILDTFNRQTWMNKRLVLSYATDFTPKQSPVTRDIHVLSVAQAATRRVSSIGEGGYIASLHVDDYYGPNYFTDFALAANYSDLPIIGKVARYRMEAGVPMLASEGTQYRRNALIARRRGIALAANFDESIVAWLDAIDDAIDGDGLAVDEFNYCEGAGDMQVCPVVDDLPDVDLGMPVDELLSIAERIQGDHAASGRVQRDESAGMPALEAATLFELLGAPDNKYLSTSFEGGELIVRSTVPAGRHAYAHLSQSFAPEQLHFTDIARMQLVGRGGDGLSLVLIYLDVDGQKISHSIMKSASNLTVTVPSATHAVQVGVRITRPGEFRIRRLVFDHVPLPIDTLVTRSRHLLLAKNYPSYDDLYKHAFVHRRVVEYRRRGIDVDVFRIGANGLSFYEFEGVDVAYGQADHLRAMLRSGDYQSILVHVLDARMWEVLQEFVDRVRIYVWAHGSEMQSASRRDFEFTESKARERAIAMGEQRMQFWRKLFSEAHPNMKMVFVSSWAARDVMDDVGIELGPDSYSVIHNFIDCELFAYEPKPVEQRKRILSIRPYASKVYANDLSVQAILELSSRPFFSELEFRIIGDGPLFEETIAPLRRFDNVLIEQGFLTQAQIAVLHRQYGVFLVPSRMDSQGVSRDEAMASGLVPVTTRVAAIPEFVDDTCGLLVEPEDAHGLAAAIEQLYHDPRRYLRLSAQAAARVRRQSGSDLTIARELELFGRGRSVGHH